MHRRGLSVLRRPTKLPAAGYSSNQYEIVFGTHECEIACLTEAEVTESVLSRTKLYWATVAVVVFKP